jgi:omega-6 fatty acid desaturase (delta-12 desaturase)
MDSEAPSATLSWKQAVAAYQKPVLRSSLWQIVNTLVPYFALWGFMIWTLEILYWLTLVIAVLAAGFLARIFMIFHDCAHGSFLRSRRANHFVEFVTGVLTLTPYRQWRHKHAVHHATSGNLDQRGTGDIWTLTVEEYLNACRWKRLSYRIVRSPLVLFIVAPLAFVALMSVTIGFKAYLLIQLPVVLFAGVAGVWLFYVQHQFDGVYWERRPNWDFADAALRGSPHYKLPKALQWFSGNIGFHHIHHLSPAIPNYSLEKCHRENPMLCSRKSFRSRCGPA